MAALAGFDVGVYAGSSATPTDEVAGLNSIEAPLSRDMIDVTTFSANAGGRNRLAGLVDIPITMSGFYEASDTAQTAIRSGWAAGTTVYVLIRFDGSGAPSLEVPCLVESWSISANPEGALEFTASFQQNGAHTFTAS